MMMEIVEVFLIAFAAGAIVAFLYGRKHQRWTNERRTRGAAGDAPADDTLRPGRLGVSERLP